MSDGSVLSSFDRDDVGRAAVSRASIDGFYRSNPTRPEPNLTEPNRTDPMSIFSIDAGKKPTRERIDR